MMTRRRRDTAPNVAMMVTLILVAFISAIGCMYDARLDGALVLFGVACMMGAYCVRAS